MDALPREVTQRIEHIEAELTILARQKTGDPDLTVSIVFHPLHVPPPQAD